MNRLTLPVKCILFTALAACSRCALAHEDDGPPLDPTVISPGLKLLGVVALVAIGVTVWYQWRKRSLLRGEQNDRK